MSLNRNNVFRRISIEKYLENLNFLKCESQSRVMHMEKSDDHDFFNLNARKKFVEEIIGLWY